MSKEVDPCVGYSSDQKLWVYLHKNRKAQDFGKDFGRLKLIFEQNSTKWEKRGNK